MTAVADAMDCQLRTNRICTVGVTYFNGRRNNLPLPIRFGTPKILARALAVGRGPTMQQGEPAVSQR